MIIAVIGLGYVGAPLTVELAKHFDVIGFDINKDRVHELTEFKDRTNEITEASLKSCSAFFTSEIVDVEEATIYIVTVPTPIAEGNVPNLLPVMSATRAVGSILKKDNIVIYESTVYPGVTEELCVPLLEQHSNLKWKEDFNVGYSPERINPGDRIHTLTKTTKIVSGDTSETLEILAEIYGAITDIYQAPSIKVAEAAKVIENVQRDVNIALMNELSQIFKRMEIDTNDVIDAAASKWNFMSFRPGLVGGHCISVDPYYLSHKAATQGFIADVILSSREINDSVPAFVVDQLIQLMVQERLIGSNPVVTIMGVTFKEDVPDIRNSKVLLIVEQLKKYGIKAQLTDPNADLDALKREGIELTEELEPADAIILAVAHDAFKQFGWELITAYAKESQKVVLMDLKGVLPRDKKPENIVMWRP